MSFKKVARNGLLAGSLAALIVTITLLDTVLPPPDYSSLESFSGEVVEIKSIEKTAQWKLTVEGLSGSRTFYVSEKVCGCIDLRKYQSKSSVVKLNRRFWWFGDYRAWELIAGGEKLVSFEAAKSDQLAAGDFSALLLMVFLSIASMFLLSHWIEKLFGSRN